MIMWRWLLVPFGYIAFCFLISGIITLTLAYAFDVPDQYLRQGYHQCDSPSGWCDNEKEEKPCGKQ